MKNWKLAIVTFARWRQLLKEHDTHNAFPWHLPAVAASGDRIAIAQAAAGIEFSSDYKALLEHADGWKGFCIAGDLFGTSQIIDGQASAVRQSPAVAAYLASAGLSPSDVIAIAASDQVSDVFLLVTAHHATLPGAVLWWGDEEIDRWEDVWSFFLGMIALEENRARRIAAKDARTPN